MAIIAITISTILLIMMNSSFLRSKSYKIFLLLAAFVLLLIICFLFGGRYAYQQGVQQMYQKEYVQAEQSFVRALGYIPQLLEKFATADLQRIYSQLGRAQYYQAMKVGSTPNSALETYQLLKQASVNLQKSLEIDPLDCQTTYRLAKTEAILEYLFPRLYGEKKENPHLALALYKRAMGLRPAGVTVHYDFARYLAYHNMREPLAEVVAYLTEIYPQSYFKLKREDFFTAQLRQEAQIGLQQALTNSTSPGDAFRALSAIALTEDNLPQALNYYQSSLEYRPLHTLSADSLHLGMLLLKHESYEESFEAFETSLSAAADKEKLIEQIYKIFKREKLFEKYILFSVYLDKHGSKSLGLDLSVARCRMDMKQPELAKARLILINAEGPQAAAYYLLAKIAETQEDWNQMELAIQRATVLDQDNWKYLSLFAKALHRQNKYKNAEEIISKAIAVSANKSPWLYSQRAWTRWSLKNYAGAEQDWKQSVSRAPERGEFYYCLSLTYQKRNMTENAIQYATKALSLDPDNTKFLKWKQSLEK